MVKRNAGAKTTRITAMNKTKNAIRKSEQSSTKGSAFKKSANSANPNRPDPAGGKAGSQFRTRATIKRIKMYNSKPADEGERRKTPTDPTIGRIEPDRKWFGNTRTVD